MRLSGLLASLGALLTAFGADGRSRVQATAIDRAHARAAARRSRLEYLQALDGRRLLLAPEACAELQRLRLSRGKIARRMARQRARAAKKKGRTPGATPALRLGDRIPRTFRLAILRADGRPVSGRQWRQLRKAARRQEGAA